MPRRFTTDSPIAEILAAKKPNQKTVGILMEPEIGSKIKAKEQEIAKLEMENSRAKNKNLANPIGKKIETAKDELEELITEADNHVVEFTFQDIGRKRYDDLVGHHQPTKEQKEEYKEGGGQGVLAYNPETFPAALISATAIDPEISLEDAQVICDEWSEGDIETLFFAAISACKERANVPLSKKGTEATQNSHSDSITPPSEESPTPNS